MAKYRETFQITHYSLYAAGEFISFTENKSDLLTTVFLTKLNYLISRISTRRFFERPFSVALEATGSALPLPTISKSLGLTFSR